MRKVRVLSPSFGVESYFARAGGYKAVPTCAEADLIVFTGGSDVSPSLYGEKALPCSHTHAQRDADEKIAFERYKTIPKVGICRGGQFLNVMSGGAMWQDVTNHGNSHKIVNLLKVPGIEDDDILVTSTHHQMMIPGDKGHVLAIALNDKGGNKLSSRYMSAKVREVPDYDTEVVWYPETNSLCFQPHPEYSGKDPILDPMSKYFFKLIDHFFFDQQPETV